MRIFIFFIFFIFLAEAIDIKKLLKEAKKGDINALTKLAMIYEYGDKNIKPDLELAKRYYSQAAELGSEDAKIALALLNLNEKIDNSVSLTNNVTVDGKNNLYLKLNIKDLRNILRRAKEMDKDALYTLATIYENGLANIKPDINRAKALYKKAALLGSKKAKNVLKLIEE